MRTFDIKVGYACNNECIHCVIKDEKNALLQAGEASDLTFDEVVSLLDNAVARGAEQVVLTGGEITIRKDCVAIFTYCAAKKMCIAVQTNGRNLNKRALLEAIAPIKNIKFIIALHGATGTTHDQITQRNGSFDETCRGISAVTTLGKCVVTKVVLSKHNMKELYKIPQLCASLNVEHLCVAYPHGHGAARENYIELAPSYNELKPHLNKLISEAEINNIHLQFEAVPCCVIPEKFMLASELLDCNGSRSYFVPVGKGILNWEEIRKEIKKKFFNCSRCVFDMVCEGVWEEYVDHYGGNDLKPLEGGDVDRKRLYDVVVGAKNNML